MIEGIDPENDSEIAGVLVQVRFYEPQCFCQNIVHPAFGEAGNGCDLLVGVFLLAAEAVHLLFLGRELAECLIYQLLVFPGEDELFQGAVGLREIAPDLADHFLFAGNLAEMVQRAVTDHAVEIGFRGIDIGKVVPLDPESEKTFLDDLFGVCRRFGHGEGESEEAFTVEVKQYPEGMFLACREQIFSGIRGVGYQSVPL